MKTLFLKKQTEGAQQRFDVFCNKNENDAHRALFTKEYLTKDIDEQLYFYECSQGKTLAGNVEKVLEVNLKKGKNLTHVIVLNDLEDKITEKYRESANVRFVERDSEEYIKNLSRAKMIISNDGVMEYFIRNEGQTYIFFMDDNFDAKSIRKNDYEKIGKLQQTLFQVNIIVGKPAFTTEFLKKIDMDTAFLGKEMEKEEFFDILITNRGFDITPQKRSDKKFILFYPGGLKTNGLTNSFLNLGFHLDYEQYEYFAVMDRFEPNRARNIEKIHPKIKRIYKQGYYGFTAEEYAKYEDIAQQGIHGRFAFIRERKIPRTLFVRERKRIFGDTQFEHVINYDGYSVNWTALFAFGEFPDKIVYQHADMKQEMTRVVNGQKIFERVLGSIFSIYDYYDKIVSVSKGVSKVNKEALKETTRHSDQHVWVVENLLRPDLIEDKLKNEKQFEYDGKRYLAGDFMADGMNMKVRGVEVPDQEAVNFICSGRLSYEKGHAKLLRAFCQVVEKYPKTNLYIAGDGPLKSEIANLIKKLNLEDHVIMTGYMENPFALMRYTDCLVLSSDHEGQGMVLLEAMIMNKYCISTDIDGPRSFLTKDYGELVENSEDGLAQGMIRYIENRPVPKVFSAEQYNDNAKKEFYDMLEA